MRMSLEFEDVEEFVDVLTDLPDAADVELAEAVARSAIAAQRIVQQRAPGGAGGRVGTAVELRTTGSGPGTESRVVLTGPAIPVALGSRPHAIAPKNVRALAFEGRFAARVDHPGNPSNPFFQRGIADAETEFDHELDDAADRVAQTIEE